MIPVFQDIAECLGIFWGGWGPLFHNSHVILEFKDLEEDLVVPLT